MKLLDDYGVLFGFESHKSSFLSNLIKFSTDSEVSHTFNTLGSLMGHQIVLEADYAGFNVNLFRKYVKDPDFYLELYALKDYSPGQLRRAVSEAIRKYGEANYGFGQASFIPFLGLFGPPQEVDNPVDDGIICSEASFYILRELDKKLIKGYKPNNVGPKEIYEIVKPIAEKIAVKEYGNNVLTFLK